MGSETSPLLLYQSVEKSLLLFPGVHFHLFVLKDLLHRFTPSPFVHFHSSSQTIEMEDDPLIAVREKKDSTLLNGLKFLRDNAIDVFISAGNTGALIAGATLFIPKKEGIKRPALLATLPTQSGHVMVLDVGGNIGCKAELLIQFAHLGIDYLKEHLGYKTPRLALLNIGIESKKGTHELKKTYSYLKEEQHSLGIVFVGNIEARSIFDGKVDLVVTDGFTGNIFLKTVEGVSHFFLNRTEEFLSIHQEQALFTTSQLKKEFNCENYGGALLCGLDRQVVKCHGNCSVETLCAAISKILSRGA